VLREEPLALLLDLGGDRDSAIEWASKQLAGYRIEILDKAALKWSSRREALSKVRSLAPGAFAFFTSDAAIQSSRGLMMLFAAAAGARLIAFGDALGFALRRTRAGVLAKEAPRLVFELLVGYLFLVPASWLLTVVLGAQLRRSPLKPSTRKVGAISSSEPGSRPAESSTTAGDTDEPEQPPATLSALYVKATLVPAGAAGETGGMAAHTRGFASAARKLGHRIQFITSSMSGVDDLEATFRIPPPRALSATRVLLELNTNLVFTFRALRWLGSRKAGEFDFIYQRYNRFNWTGAVLSLITGLPLLLEFNGSEVWISRYWDPIGLLPLLTRFEAVNLKAADLIFVVSDVQRRLLIDSGVDRNRIIVNPNGVDTEAFRPNCGGDSLRESFGIEPSTLIGFVGTFGPWHGAEVLAQAATKLLAGSVHFLFVGDGERRKMAEAVIAQAGRKDLVTFTGKVKPQDVPRYLDACDVLVSPQTTMPDGSEFFGSPTKLFEYMAMAKAIIASRLGQMAQVIEDGENGLLVSPGDPNELAGAIRRLASDAPLRTRLGLAARSRVETSFTWRQNAIRVFAAAARLGTRTGRPRSEAE
jgi:glycosyltransferase involved in cell wall biosynthesis